MNTLNCVLLLAALFATTYATSSNWGYRSGVSYLAFEETVLRKASPGVRSVVDVVFPKSGQVNARQIQAIIVDDRYTNNTGAIANVILGGPGSTTASIRLLSQNAEGIHSTVYVYVK